MSNNIPRLPVRHIKQNADLLKSQEVLSGGEAGKGTDWTDQDIEHSNLSPGVVSSYRVPDHRVLGNLLFRRNLDGSLDLEAAKHVVVDIIHKVKDKVPLTELEKIVLSCMFPTLFSFVDFRLTESLAKVQLRLAPWEVVMIQNMVAAHITSEMNWNAGLGGGFAPGTEQRRA